MSSISVAFVRMSVQMSIVKMVELELKMEVNEDIKADIITASMRPRAPEERNVMKWSSFFFSETDQ